MMKKTIKTSNTAEVVGGKKFSFAVNSKYIFGGNVHTVRKAYFEDNTELRMTANETGNEEISTLKSLFALSAEPTFSPIFDAENDCCEKGKCNCKSKK